MRPYTAEEVETCSRLWASFAPGRCQVTPEILLAQTVGSSLFEPAASAVSDEGFVAAKWSPHERLFPGSDSGALHLTAVTHPTLLGWAVDQAKSLGAARVAIGADHDHIMPGLPLVPGWGGDMTEALESLGFVKVGGFACDLERDLSGYTPYDGCLEALDKEGFMARTATEADLDATEAFLQETFPGRWRHDVVRKLRAGEGHQIDLLVKEGEVYGFSATQNESTRHVLAGGVWKASLGDNWASLGPIGVSAKVRGLKLGGALLGASLLRLANEGARQTIIDWTTLVDFYGMHGFEVAREYQGWSLPLTDR